MKITIDIPDTKVKEVLDAVAWSFDRPDQLPADDWTENKPKFVPNPETKEAHLRRRVSEFINDIVRNRTVRLAQEAAQAAAAKASSDLEAGIPAVDIVVT